MKWSKWSTVAPWREKLGRKIPSESQVSSGLRHRKKKLSKPTTTSKALSRILDREMIKDPVVQVLAFKKVDSPENNGVVTHRFILSDGDNMYQWCIINGDEHDERIQKGDIQLYALIRLDQYTIQ